MNQPIIRLLSLKLPKKFIDRLQVYVKQFSRRIPNYFMMESEFRLIQKSIKKNAKERDSKAPDIIG